MHENEIAYFIRGAIFKVYQILGPGLLESAYEAALNYECKTRDWQQNVNCYCQCGMRAYHWMRVTGLICS